VNLLCPSQGALLNHGQQRRASPKLLELRVQTSEELMEAKNVVVLLVKTTTVTRPLVCQHERVKLMPHVSQLMVENINGGVLLLNGAGML
jgi:hypothetical protein